MLRNNSNVEIWEVGKFNIDRHILSEFSMHPILYVSLIYFLRKKYNYCIMLHYIGCFINRHTKYYLLQVSDKIYYKIPIAILKKFKATN